jgi:hypothetical protein
MSIILLGTDKNFVEKIQVPINVRIFIPRDLSRTEELYFGSHYCNSYLITASGSTFAWWMAYLMSEESQTRIFYNYLSSRNKRFGKDSYDYDTYPAEWRRLRLFNVSQIGYEPRWHKDIPRGEDKFSTTLHQGS